MATPKTPPLGYENLLRPESLSQTYKTEQVVDKAVSICKSAIQDFIDSFLSPKGKNRRYLQSTISSEGLQYVTSLSYDDEMKVRPNLKKTMLARWFGENIAKLPSILIIDQGVQSVDVGINALTRGYSFMNRWQASVLFIGKVSLSVSVTTYSEEDTSTLSQLVLYILDTLPDLVNFKLIHNPNQKWEVRLPISGITAGQMTGVTVQDDNKTQVWMRAIDIEVEIETVVSISAPTPTVVNLKHPNPVFAQQEGAVGNPTVLNLAPNQSIPLGAPYQLYIKDMTLDKYLGISDPNIALISSEAPWYLQPKRQGSALLYVFTSASLPGMDPQTQMRQNLLFDIPFRVTPY